MTMALLENLVAGNIYLVKIAASNEVGEGPFSNAVEFAVLPKETPESNQRPKRLDSGDSTAYSDYYHLDQKSMTGIVVGVCIALTCILICILILIYRSKARKASAPKAVQQSTDQLSHTSISLPSPNELEKNIEGIAENEQSLLPMIVGNSFIDAKGGSDLIINSYGPVTKTNGKKRWLFFQDAKKAKTEEPQRRFVCLYQPCPAVLLGRAGSPGSPGPQPSFPGPFGAAADTEHSANSEGSHETGDSGRFSHESNDEIHLSPVGGGTPPGSSPLASRDSAAGSPQGGRAPRPGQGLPAGPD
ncbi:hypothetical protein EK904_007764 [Melospiza melodia maxima]|nr:hypothetical protein EK904_007764 [Melospiza melodia maxima]